MRTAHRRAIYIGLMIAAALPRSLWGALQGAGMTQSIFAVRTGQRIQIDGNLDELAWQTAPPFMDFVQSFPNEGAAPSERTEVRVLYDDEKLYLGVICYDSRPDQIVSRLGRRDRQPFSDIVSVAIDSSHEHRSAYLFSVNAAGVLMDALIYDDNQVSQDWDAVWDAATAMRSDGWSAEFAIPLQILRFPQARTQTWGFVAHREIARRHETIDSVVLPRNANAMVSLFGHLEGVKNLKPRQDIELLPYSAVRISVRPQFSDDSIPHPRLVDPSADVGMDFKVGLTSELTLNGTINPDFGQVEADQVILNLSNFEQFFPEKRPFFTQGMDLFQPVGTQYGLSPQTMFYSRRIGLNTPILGAAKLTGTARRGLEIGVLDAFVVGSSAPSQDEANPDRRLGYHLARPFHLGLEDSLPAFAPTPINYFFGVAHQKVARNSTVGASLSAATPMAPFCTEEEANLSDSQRPTYCDVKGGNAAAVHWNLRTANGDWGFFGQAASSRVVRGPLTRTLRDGTVVHPGDAGYGTYFAAGKLGGEPLRFDLRFEYASPKLDLNPVGFQPDQNLISAKASVGLVRASGPGPLKSFGSRLLLVKDWSSDGRLTNRGGGMALNVSAIFPGFNVFGLFGGYDSPSFDLREISKKGIPFERPPRITFGFFGNSDPNRLLNLGGEVFFGKRTDQRFLTRTLGMGTNLTFTLRPHSRLETQLQTSYDYTPSGARYIDALGDDQFVFANLDAYVFSFTLRQLLVITPRLTLQAYAQLFTDYGRYGAFYGASSNDHTPIHLSDLRATGYGSDPNFHHSALNLNLVLRWEYRLGSTLFVVYSRSQRELPVPSGAPVPFTLFPRGLSPGPAADVLLIKWTYWWSV